MVSIQYIKNGEREINLNTRIDIKHFLNSEKAKHKNILIKFSAVWCGPCKHMNNNIYDSIQNIMNNTETNYISKKSIDIIKKKKEIIIIDVDVDKYSDISSYFKIRSLPTIITFYNGERNNVMTGSQYNDFVELLCNLE